MRTPSSSSPSRRGFLQASGGAVAAGALGVPALAAGDRPQERPQDPDRKPERGEPLRVGLVGTGGRGTGAAANALRADPDARLVAVADIAADRIERAIGGLSQTEDVAAQVDVPTERRYGGFDGFQKVIDQDLDLVVLATPPHFRPEHIEYAINQGVNVFAEKPVAVDGPGIRRVQAACKMAEAKGLSVVSGLCYRYHDGRRAVMERVHRGDIGDIVTMEANYITGGLWHRGNDPQWSEMEYQCRNWIYFNWLSGDHINEQHIHSLDVMAWAKQDVYPVKCVSLGGRQSRTDEKYGNVFDHFATRYEWADGTMGYSYCRQQVGCKNEVSDHIRGTLGKANVFGHEITGENPWKDERNSGRMFGAMYQNEHDELLRAIRDGKPVNNGEYMCHSTVMALMGRDAGYTGKEVTFDEVLNSEDRLGPTVYEWGAYEPRPVAIPGRTKLG